MVVYWGKEARRGTNAGTVQKRAKRYGNGEVNMAFQPVPNAAQAIIHYQGAVYEFSNSLWFTKSVFGTSDMNDLAGALMGSIVSHWDAWFANDYTCDYVRVYDMRVDGAPIVTYNTVQAPGLDADELLPRGDALVVTLRTATRGRSGRGRIYLGGLTSGQEFGGEFGAPIIAQTGAWITQMKALIEAAGWQWVVCSRYHDGVKRAQGATFPVLQWQVRSGIPGSQDRRNKRP